MRKTLVVPLLFLATCKVPDISTTVFQNAQPIGAPTGTGSRSYSGSWQEEGNAVDTAFAHWNLEYPGRWAASARSIGFGCGHVIIAQGFFVGNVDAVFPRQGITYSWSQESRGEACGDQEWNRPPPLDFVAMQFTHSIGGPLPDCRDRPDTATPLSLRGAHEEREGTLRRLAVGIIMHGCAGNILLVWIGSRAATADVETLRAIVASIVWDGVLPPRD